MGHTIRLEEAQLLMKPQGSQWTPHCSPLGPQHWLGVGPTSQQGTWAAAESFIQFSRSVESDSLRPHESQHARPPCPSSELLKLMSIELVMASNHLILCHPLLLLPSVFPSIGSFQMSQLFPSGGKSTGASASASILPMNIQD